jgi:acetyl-CoA acetyltransferase
MVDFAMDEHPKPKTTIEQLAKLPTVFKKVIIIIYYSIGQGGARW